jgi:hypothetical protein
MLILEFWLGGESSVKANPGGEKFGGKGGGGGGVLPGF